jgi:hypothetical protein
MRGCADARMRGCADARMRGCADARMRGCADANYRSFLQRRKISYLYNNVTRRPLSAACCPQLTSIDVSADYI